VVASPSKPIPEVLGDAALFHDPDDPAALSTHVERLMQDDVLRTRQVALGRAQAARYGWDRAGAETAAVLRTAATAPRN
jgi:glycosyltransferase involved in cell wall biosynthesis